jgi:hypothetical protein
VRRFAVLIDAVNGPAPPVNSTQTTQSQPAIPPAASTSAIAGVEEPARKTSRKDWPGHLSSRSRIAIAAVFALLICVAATFYFWPKGATNKSIAIVVLPFENLSHSPEVGAVADQIRRQVITRLETLGRLRVVSSDDLVQDKPIATFEVRENLKRLGVTHLLRVLFNVQATR